MAIDSYSSLKAVLSTRFGDTALDSQRDDFIDLAEAYFNRKLRCFQMEEQTTLTTASDGTATLPTDMVALRSVRYDGSPLIELKPTSIGTRNRLSPFDTAGIPTAYTITSIANVKTITVVPIMDAADLIVTYFEKIPALDDTTTTNWLLALAPDAYLHRCLAEGYTARQQFDKAQGYAQHAEAICDELNSLDERARYGNAEIILDGCNP